MSQEWTRIEHTGSFFEFKKLQKLSKVETYKLSIQIIIFKRECMIAVGYPSNCFYIHPSTQLLGSYKIISTTLQCTYLFCHFTTLFLTIFPVQYTNCIVSFLNHTNWIKDFFFSHCQMNVRHCCQMALLAQLVAEEMGFGQGWNSPSHTWTILIIYCKPPGC